MDIGNARSIQGDVVDDCDVGLASIVARVVESGIVDGVVDFRVVLGFEVVAKKGEE